MVAGGESGGARAGPDIAFHTLFPHCPVLLPPTRAAQDAAAPLTFIRNDGESDSRCTKTARARGPETAHTNASLHTLDARAHLPR